MRFIIDDKHLTVLGKKHYYQLLPNVEFSLYKNCFINRCLFKFR